MDDEVYLKCTLCDDLYLEKYQLPPCCICHKSFSQTCRSCQNHDHLECKMCLKTFCPRHLEDGNHFTFTCYATNPGHAFDICRDCFLENNTGRCSRVNILDTLNYIRHLQSEIDKLQLMVDYQPGGQGFVEAKKHFDELSETSKN